MNKYTCVIIIIWFFVPTFGFGQTQDAKQKIYNLFDSEIGVDNTGIYNGIEYRESFRTLDNNFAYFESPNFTKGNIVYDGQIYYDIDLKYNLFDQEVIVKLMSKNSSETVVKLYNNKIKSFTIGNRKFIKINLKNPNAKVFYEEILKDVNFSLLTKHQKFKKDLYENEQMYLEYVTASKEYLVSLNGSYSVLDSKKDIINLFPNLKQKINLFFREHKSLRKTNYDQFLINLLQELKLAKLK